MALTTEILDAYRNGDRNAYTTIYELLHERILAVAFKILQSREDAEEVTGDTFEALLKKTDFKDINHLRRWLYIVVRNKAFSKITLDKSSKFILPLDPEQLEKLAILDETYAEAVTEKRAALVKEALQLLPEECRKVADLEFIQGIPRKEIARLLGITLSTVKNQVARARKSIRKHLQKKS